MDIRMTAIENRFDTILPTLATKADVKTLELKLAESTALHQSLLNKFEIKLLETIHREVKTLKQEMHQDIQAICHKTDLNHWRMLIWMTTVMASGFAGAFYVARYLPNL